MAKTSDKSESVAVSFRATPSERLLLETVSEHSGHKSLSEFLHKVVIGAATDMAQEVGVEKMLEVNEARRAAREEATALAVRNLLESWHREPEAPASE